MDTAPDEFPELQIPGHFGNWLIQPSALTERELAELSYDVFSHGGGLKWLQAMTWQVMYSTPTNGSDVQMARDVGSQDFLRRIVAMIHQGLEFRRQRNQGVTENGNYSE